MFMRLLGISIGLILSVAAVSSGADSMPTKFTVRIENITEADAFTASNGVKWSLGFSPGVVVVHTDKGPIFTAGKNDRGQGLEAQSEDGITAQIILWDAGTEVNQEPGNRTGPRTETKGTQHRRSRERRSPQRQGCQIRQCLYEGIQCDARHD